MSHYFYVLNREWLQGRLQPALAESWRRRSFHPCRDLCRDLMASRSIPEDTLIHRVGTGLLFRKDSWHGLAGECLVFGAEDMPRLPCPIESLCCLLAPQRLHADRTDRIGFSAIEQVFYGTRDLRFGGGWYRPEQVGWNDADDLQRLSAALRAIDPDEWNPAALAPLPDLPDDAERTEELAYVRDWWPVLVEMIEQAQRLECVIVCERT